MRKYLHEVNWDNIRDMTDTQKIVIFAEADSASVVWDWPGNEGQPTDPDYNPSFANAARDWVNMNPLIIQPDGSYKPIEVKYVVAYGKDQMTSGFNELDSSGFVDDDTKLIVMGHAGGTFAGEKPGVWHEVIQDTGFRNKFSEVAYGACSQGENQNVCMDLSRSFGSDTVVHAQVGQTWGVAGSPAHFIDRWRNRKDVDASTFSSRHPVPINEFMPDPSGKATEVTHWTQQLFTVGSGRVTYPGGRGNPYVVSGGDEDYQIRENMGLQEADAFIGARQDPELLSQYWDETQEFRDEYVETEGPQPETPWATDYPDMYRTPNRADLKITAYHNLAKEYWAEKHDGADLPDDKQKLDYLGRLTDNFTQDENDAFFDWVYDREVMMEESGVLTVQHGSGNFSYMQDMLEYEVDILEANQRVRQYTPAEIAAEGEYRQAWDDWGTLREEYDTKYDKALSESGIVKPPYIGGEHLLASEDDIPFTFEEFSIDPMKSVDVMAGGASYEDLNISGRVRMLKNLAKGGNETAINAFQEAMFKVDEIDPALYDNSSMIYGHLSDIEALRLYAETGEYGVE